MAEEKSESFTLVETVNPSSDSVINKDGFVGVDPIYQNFAEKTHKPFAAGSGDEKALEQKATDRLDGKGGVENVQLAEVVASRPGVGKNEASSDEASSDETPEEPAEDPKASSTK